MSQTVDIEKLYSPSQWSKRYNRIEVLEKHIQFLEEHTKIVREKIPCKLNISYGPKQKEKYDIYGTDLKDDSPIVIHIHGGYYQEESITHSNNGFISNALYQNGIKTILLGYELCPQQTLSELLEHLQIGLRECIKYAKKLNSRGIYLSGHSVGAHAIATILTDFKKSIPQEESDLIEGAFLTCGLYNLEPLTKMSANDLLNLSAEAAKELSPLFDKIDYGNTVIHVIGAENDSPAFVDQSEEFHRKLQSDGIKTYLNIVQGVDHFDILENLYNADFEVIKIMVNFINKGS